MGSGTEERRGTVDYLAVHVPQPVKRQSGRAAQRDVAGVDDDVWAVVGADGVVGQWFMDAVTYGDVDTQTWCERMPTVYCGCGLDVTVEVQRCVLSCRAGWVC